MPSVAVLAADGFETIECLTMVDVMRRGGVRATLVSIMPTREVVSSLQIPVTCDALFDEINFDEYDCVVLPGGLPGATNLRADHVQTVFQRLPDCRTCQGAKQDAGAAER